MANLRAQYANAARIEARYRSVYGDKHPVLIAAREQLDELRVQIDQEVARVTDGFRNDYAAASKQQAELEAELASLKEESGELDQVNVALAALTREAQANRALFEQYLGRLKQTYQEQNLDFDDARVVAPALPPLKPSRPPALLLLLAAAACGLVLGLGLALVLEQIRRGLRTAEDVEQNLGLPCLGLLPDLTEQKFGKKALLPPRKANAKVRRPSRASYEYARSLSAIATRLRRSARRSSNVIVVASALPAEGKSTFACNLALASASAGVQTLLIDGDNYANEVTRMFDIEGPGLSELCQGKVDLWSVTAHDVTSGLYVIGTGDSNSPFTYGVEEEKISALLDDYRQFFELIVIDSPAILPTGGGRLIECADHVALIIEWNRTDRTAVWESLDMLAPHDRKVAGVVLNKTSMHWYDLFAQGRYLRDQYSTDFSALLIPGGSAPAPLMITPGGEGR
jgi:Mrp family chromosome partitioning ATPase